MHHAVRSLSVAAIVAVALPVPPVAQAALVSPLQVVLWAPGGTTAGPTPIDESATVDTTTGLIAGDSSNLISGFWMLPPEYIEFQNDSVLFRVAAGGPNLTTGYLGLGADSARYEIGVAVAGSTITGFTATALGGYASGLDVQLIGGNELDFGLDMLTLDGLQTDPNGYAYADFRVDLLTQPNGNPAPEPASLALAALALGALGCARKRSHRGR